MRGRFDTILIRGIATFLAALVPVIIFAANALMTARYDSLTIVSFCVAVGFPAALTLAVIVGLPVALFCLARRWTHWIVAMFGGFLMGLIITYLMMWLFDQFPAISDPLSDCLSGGLLGLSGALAFWSTLKLFGELEPRGRDTAGQAPA